MVLLCCSVDMMYKLYPDKVLNARLPEWSASFMPVCFLSWMILRGPLIQTKCQGTQLMKLEHKKISASSLLDRFRGGKLIMNANVSTWFEHPVSLGWISNRSLKVQSDLRCDHVLLFVEFLWDKSNNSNKNPHRIFKRFPHRDFATGSSLVWFQCEWCFIHHYMDNNRHQPFLPAIFYSCDLIFSG